MLQAKLDLKCFIDFIVAVISLLIFAAII